tara:strand:- start:11460 stop:12071 length:612 start_codon:yes stop_codon:yes gene_type:complete
MKKTIAIFGASGHSKVIIDIINLLDDYTIVGFYDDSKEGIFEKFPILGKIDSNIKLVYDAYVIGIGDNNIRKKIHNIFSDFPWVTLVHPSSIVCDNARIDNGTVICAGVIVQTHVTIGKHCIVNTGSSIDHDCSIGNFCSISPGAVICGGVKIEELSFIGANATIIQCLTIGSNCIIGAGSVIIRDTNDHCKIVGNPGKVIKY